MSIRSSPIRGLEPSIHQFTLEAYALNDQNQKLVQLLKSKNAQIQSLAEANSILRDTYQVQAETYRRTIGSLEKRLAKNQNSRNFYSSSIQDKYTEQENLNIEINHKNQMEFLLEEVAKHRASIQAYELKLMARDHQIATIKQSYERELAMNASEINTLNKKIMQLQEDKLKQISDLNNRRQLQKSRTTELFSSRKQSNQYIQKQLRKLNQDVLQKTIAIEGLTRDLAKQRKKCAQTNKQMIKKIQNLTHDFQAQLRQKDESSNKNQNMLKLEISQYKQKQIKLLNEAQDLRSAVASLKKQIENKIAQIKSKSDEMAAFKLQIEKIREDHNNQIKILMKQRKKASSKSNLGSSRSLGSSLKESGVLLTSAIDGEGLASKMISFLPMVKEEGTPDRKNYSELGAQSNVVQDQAQDQLARAIFHYDTIIDQLKKSHQVQLQYYKLTLQKSSGRLKEKELQLEDVLTRFSPLVKIHADEKTLQQDRKQRMERHWKADLGILQIMLKKHKIRTF